MSPDIDEPASDMARSCPYHRGEPAQTCERCAEDDDLAAADTDPAPPIAAE